jgi:ATP-dependent Lon protease
MCRRAVFFIFAMEVLAADAAFNPPARAAATASMPQQQPPEQKAPPSQPGKVKIWTNDDLIALRTPADIYILEKEAQAAAVEMQDVMACFAWNQTESTIEETQKAIQDTLESIRDSEDAVAQIRKQLDDAPENLKARNQKELERRTTELETSREQLKVLQQRLRELTKQPTGENPVASATPPPE